MPEPCCPPDGPAKCCPECGERATLVDTVTVKALLTPIALTRLGPGSFRFCATPGCDVVYFADGEQYLCADVRVPVWQKEPSGDRTVCYCFGENEAGIQREITTTGTSGAPSRIRDHLTAKRCACEVHNPRGVCCLGDVIATVVRLQASTQASVPR